LEIVETSYNFSKDTWYWIEIEVDVTNDELKIHVWDAALGSPTTYAATTPTIDDWGGDADSHIMGNHYFGEYGDVWQDNIIISNDANTELKPYANDPDYNTCN
jgi:hypothetical protein